jgi:arylsulfatase A-like enzyme
MGQPYFEAILKSWHRDVSGDVAFVLKPNWSAGGEAGTHGSPHPYDTHVPLMLYGPAWIAPGRREGRVEMVDLAPTLAQLLGIPPPPAAEGKPLALR